MGKFKKLRFEYDIPKALVTSGSYCPKWLLDCDGYVHISEMEEFIALWKRTSKENRDELVKDRMTIVQSIQEVGKPIATSHFQHDVLILNIASVSVSTVDA